MTPGRLWWLLRRDLKRGWEAAFHDYKTLRRIEEWSWPFWHEVPQTTPVHLLTGKKDFLLAAWMLASWFEASEKAWPIVIHDDGTLPAEGAATLQRLFSNARIIRRAEADAAMERVLQPFPFCQEYRRQHPLALKLFDVPHYAKGARYLMFDSDLLFFQYPHEILEWTGAERDECWFNEDVQESALITAGEARLELDVKIWPRVNSGLCLIHKPAIDPDFLDRALAETSILRGHVWRVEQTLYMLCAARHGKGGLLSKRYEVSLGKEASEDAVSRHYVGAVRDRFYAEGLKRLCGQLLAPESVEVKKS
jgi:hypothetical protein